MHTSPAPSHLPLPPSPHTHHPAHLHNLRPLPSHPPSANLSRPCSSPSPSQSRPPPPPSPLHSPYTSTTILPTTLTPFTHKITRHLHPKLSPHTKSLSPAIFYPSMIASLGLPSPGQKLPSHIVHSPVSDVRLTASSSPSSAAHTTHLRKAKKST